MELDLEVLATIALQVGPVLLLLGRESARWREELGAWRRELSGARIIIEPAKGGPADGPGKAPEDPAPPFALPPDDATDEDAPLWRHRREPAPPAWALPTVPPPPVRVRVTR